MRKNYKAQITIPLADFDAAVNVSKKFLRGMVNRIIVSHYKYGDARDQYPHKVQALPNIYERLRKYEDTGNTEWLIDVANFAMLEFQFPSHEDSHYRPTDSGESPGLV